MSFTWLHKLFNPGTYDAEEARYDAAIVEYLELWRTAPSEEEHCRLFGPSILPPQGGRRLLYQVLWRTAPSEEEHCRLAEQRFGLDEDGVGFVNQVLCSAALGTLGNWANSQEDP